MTKRPENVNEYSLLDEILCRYFRFNPERVGYAELIQMRAIYRYAQSVRQIYAINDTLSAMTELALRVQERSRRKRLYRLYLLCEAQSLERSGYDTKTLRPPMPVPWHENYY